jgi:hypothetical protein
MNMWQRITLALGIILLFVFSLDGANLNSILAIDSIIVCFFLIFHGLKDDLK